MNRELNARDFKIKGDQADATVHTIPPRGRRAAARRPARARARAGSRRAETMRRAHTTRYIIIYNQTGRIPKTSRRPHIYPSEVYTGLIQ